MCAQGGLWAVDGGLHPPGDERWGAARGWLSGEVLVTPTPTEKLDVVAYTLKSGVTSSGFVSLKHCALGLVRDPVSKNKMENIQEDM